MTYLLVAVEHCFQKNIIFLVCKLQRNIQYEGNLGGDLHNGTFPSLSLFRSLFSIGAHFAPLRCIHSALETFSAVQVTVDLGAGLGGRGGGHDFFLTT